MYPRSCYFCHETNHVVENCPAIANLNCPQCGGKHTRKNCQVEFCKFCKTLGHSITICPDLVCHQCGGKHTKRHCQLVWCKGCKKLGDHLTEKCVLHLPKVWVAPNPQDLYCRFCEKSGHRDRDCQVKQKLRCYVCGGYGHYGSDCRE